MTTRPQNPVPIAVNRIHSNRNPRLYLREDVVEGIRVQLEREREIPPWYAVVVRTREDGGYELLAGHHRLEAVRLANQNGAGIREIPAWVRDDLNDDEVNRFQVLSNLQTGLTELELGLFLLEEFPEVKARRHYGRGRQGGLRECARQLGMQESKVRRCREAAVVFQHLHKKRPGTLWTSHPERLEGKAFHLAEIARVPVRELWFYLLHVCLSERWSVDKTRRAVRMVCTHFVPLLEEYRDWLAAGTEDLVGLFVSEYAAGNTNLSETLETVRGLVGFPLDIPAHSSIDRRSASQSGGARTLIVGDALDVLPSLEAGTIDLVVTSPPWYNTRHVPPSPRFPDFAAYDQFFGNLAGSLLSALAGGRFCCIHIADTNDPEDTKQRLPLVSTATQRFLAAGFIYVDQIILTRNFPAHSRSPAWNRHRRPSASLSSLHDVVLVFRKPWPDPFPTIDPDIDRRWLTTVWSDLPVAKRLPGDNTPLFRPEIPHRLIRMYSQPGDRVLDPFAGTGTTLIEAATLGRGCIGIDCREDVVPMIQGALPDLRVSHA